VLEIDGADGGTRTHGPHITSVMLYQLSYVGSNNKSCIERYGITSREDAAVRSLAF
jgi:hypothetical protein